MNIPDRSHPCWAKLAAGVPGFTPRQLALQLLFTRLRHEAISTAAKADALHAFFVKYEKILSAELQQLQGLHVL
ncbi:MAG: hypothetical protein HYV96_05850 [Opitutae bacterium]|nr:hypothetical protein [Opitutae bacterium]